MSEFQILDERRFPLKMDNTKDLLAYWRWEHRVTLGQGARDFMVFVDNLSGSVYIEEVIGGHLEKIYDDSLHEAIVRFAEEKDFLEILIPLLKNKDERLI